MPGELESIETALRFRVRLVGRLAMDGLSRPWLRSPGMSNKSRPDRSKGSGTVTTQLVDGSLRWTFRPELTIAPSPRE